MGTLESFLSTSNKIMATPCGQITKLQVNFLLMLLGLGLCVLFACLTIPSTDTGADIGLGIVAGSFGIFGAVNAAYSYSRLKDRVTQDEYLNTQYLLQKQCLKAEGKDTALYGAYVDCVRAVNAEQTLTSHWGRGRKDRDIQLENFRTECRNGRRVTRHDMLAMIKAVNPKDKRFDAYVSTFPKPTIERLTVDDEKTRRR